MKIHDLKCWPEPFHGLCVGRKTHEYRQNDRGYAFGDVLILREWKDGEYTGALTARIVNYINAGPEFGIPEGYVVMSVGLIE